MQLWLQLLSLYHLVQSILTWLLCQYHSLSLTTFIIRYYNTVISSNCNPNPICAGSISVFTHQQLDTFPTIKEIARVARPDTIDL